ncbi:glycoside hydrolase family 36 protein [Agromyces bauzanensis]
MNSLSVIDERITRSEIGHSALGLSWGPDRPVSLDLLDGPGFFGRRGVSLVEVFTATEQRARTSQAYSRSAVGERLRFAGCARDDSANARTVCVVQRDATTGLVVRTSIEHAAGTRALRVQSTLENTSDVPIVLTAVATTFGFAASEDDLDDVVMAHADSEWLAENRWRETPLRSALPRLDLGVHGQDGRGSYACTSHGAWSTGAHLNMGVLTRISTSESIAWQIDTSGAWHWELSQTRLGGVVSLLGPTDQEHQFAHALAPGATFTTVPVALATSPDGRDGSLAELTRYRRISRHRRPADAALPVVYNDFMNTLMGQPSTEALIPLIDAAADAGAEVFCIDAGWFADPAIGDWWGTVGEWREAPTRFTGGLGDLIDRIHARGMRSGLWLEPEVVGVASPVATTLPDDAFFTRFGRRVREHDRYHLDFRHPAARDHLDSTIDVLVAEFGISYLKLDYNINPGAGTDWRATSAGDGLLGHTRAFRDWLQDVQARHPNLLIENCSSGAMRADFSLLAVTHLQSTSDQQDLRLYPPIAASAPASILPEQCGNWAYPHVDLTDEETAFTLVTGLSGRLYLSGFLHELRSAQVRLVREAVELHRRLRADLETSIPFWPLGLPGWDDDVVALGHRTRRGDLLFIWDRTEDAQAFQVPGMAGRVTQLFPCAAAPWTVSSSIDGDLEVETMERMSARVLLVERGGRADEATSRRSA